MTTIADKPNYNNTFDSARIDPSQLEAPQFGQKELKKQDFIRLLLKEVTSQSPLKPYETSQMLQQMAQLSSLSSSEELSGTIKALANDLKQNQAEFNETVTKNQLLTASQMIGKTVLVPSDVAPMEKPQGLKGSVVLTSPAASVKIEIKNEQNEVVKTINLGASSAGVLDFNWDGLGEDKKFAQEGLYSLKATAMQEGKEVNLITAGSFKVNSVTRDPKTTSIIFNVDGMGGVPMDNIIKYT